MKLSTLAQLGSLSLLAATAAHAQTVIAAGDLDLGGGTTTWTTAASPYILQGPVYVKNGTLRINAGVIIRGQPQSGPAIYDPGTLVITRSAMIDAQGTSTNPVILTSAAVDKVGGVDDTTPGADGAWDDVNNDGKADRWVLADGLGNFLDDTPLSSPLTVESPAADKTGMTAVKRNNVGLNGGLVILGYAPTNCANFAGLGLGERSIEGIPVASGGAYGGFDPNDNSGSLRYVSVRHSGGFIDANNDINGITLGGVGSGTKFEYCESYCSGDDGIEFFGGTVNSRYLASIFSFDDSFDFDEGFSGLNQFWFVVAYDKSSIVSGGPDKGFEWDGDHRDDSGNELNLFNQVLFGTNPTGGAPVYVSLPKTAPVIYNATVIGGGSGAGITGSSNIAINARDNAGGSVFNSIFTEYKNGGLRLEGFGANDSVINAAGVVTGSATVKNDVTRYRLEIGEMTFRGNVFWNCGATNDNAGVANSTASSSIGTPNDYETVIFTGIGTIPAGSNTIANPGMGTFARTAIGGVNPRPLRAGQGGTMSQTVGREPLTATFFTTASYKGAFPASGSQKLWTTGWSALNASGNKVLVD